MGLADKFMQNVLDTAVIPDNSKFGLASPVYKGYGSDPVATYSYSNITVLTKLRKVFEKLIVKRLIETFTDADLPNKI